MPSTRSTSRRVLGPAAVGQRHRLVNSLSESSLFAGFSTAIRASSATKLTRARCFRSSFSAGSERRGAPTAPAGFRDNDNAMASASVGRSTEQIPPTSSEERARWHERSERLYRDLLRPARALIRRAFGSTFTDEEVEDIYANAWLGTLRTLERRHSGLSDEEIRRYVLTAVANHASKELRRRRRKPTAPLEAAGAVADVANDPEDSAAKREVSQIARDVLASLPPRRRAVMLLRYGWGLEPKEVCSLVKGLSPRAYRKEITRGVDEIAGKMRLVEAGKWCAEREPVLKAYAAGVADREEALQAQQHISHCRHCADFVGRLSGHLHDLGAAAVLPVAALNLGDPSIGERLFTALERVREGASALVSRSEAAAEVVPAATAARGAGAAGTGVLAKLAGLGGAGKAALACLGGGAAATACVAAGLAPLSLGSAPKHDQRPERRNPPLVRVDSYVETPAPDPNQAQEPPKPEPKPEPKPPEQPTRQPEPAPDSAPPSALEPTTPPVTQEFGVASAAAGSAPSGGGAVGTSKGVAGAVAREFGP